MKSYVFPNKAHSLMGFHDSSAIDPSSGRMILLGVDVMDRPPIPGEKAQLGITDWCSGATRVIAETDAWNFPQGGRQHFIRNGEAITYNRSESDIWVGVLHNLSDDRELVLDKPLYAVSPDYNHGYGLNFARLHRLGGYGYVGLNDLTEAENLPDNDGLWEINMTTGRSRLLVSIAEAAGIGKEGPRDCPHYLTHVQPSPDGKRLCFLHRYWLPDGGIQTRLMVCDAGGDKLECWASGYLSHFDWWDNSTIMIWGRPPSVLQQGRNHPLLRVPIIRQTVQWGKPLIRKILKRGKTIRGSYMLITETGFSGKSFAPELLQEDGHPSLRPGSRDWLLTDTYPNVEGIRPLILTSLVQPKLYQLAEFREARLKAREDKLSEAMQGIDARVRRSFTPRLFAHTRSGIHCDFHPRWRPDGNAVCFDSNHEGSRKVYSLEVGPIISG